MYTGSGTFDGRVYALNGLTGVQKWSFPTLDSTWYAPAVGVDGTVYALSYDRHIYAIEGATGSERWVFRTGGFGSMHPLIGADGTVYVAGDRLYALNGRTGAVKWSLDWVGLPLAIGPDGTLFIGGENLLALDPERREVKWSAPIVRASVAVGSDGVVYAASTRLYALEGATGQEKWSRAAAQSATNKIANHYVGYGSLALAPNGVLLVVEHVPYPTSLVRPRGKLVALESATGLHLWESVETSEITSTPAVGQDGVIYAGTASGVYYAFDGATGLIQWGLNAATNGGRLDMIVSSPNIGANGLVYFGGDGFQRGVRREGVRRWRSGLERLAQVPRQRPQHRQLGPGTGQSRPGVRRVGRPGGPGGVAPAGHRRRHGSRSAGERPDLLFAGRARGPDGGGRHRGR